MPTGKNEDGYFRPIGGETEVISHADEAAGLAGTVITRSQVLKLAGAAVAGTALSMIWAGEADAKSKNRRRRRRRRRRRAVTSSPSTVNFGDTTIATPSPAEDVTIKNEGNTPLTLKPSVVGDGFSIDPTFPGLNGFTLQPGDTVDVPVIFTPGVLGDSEGLLRIRDTDGLLVEDVKLLGNGIV